MPRACGKASQVRMQASPEASASHPCPARSKHGHTAAGIGKKPLSGANGTRWFRIPAAEHTCCLTASDIFDHLVKSGCANFGEHECLADAGLQERSATLSKQTSGGLATHRISADEGRKNFSDLAP